MVAPCACASACMPKQTPNTGSCTFLSSMARDSPVQRGFMLLIDAKIFDAVAEHLRLQSASITGGHGTLLQPK